MKIQEDKGLTMENIFSQEKVIVIDFGGQYNQLVARRVRECNVYCEIYSYRTDIEQIKAMNPKGIILTGGPNSCYEPDSPTYTKELFELGIPVLGLCYGAQLMMHVLGGKVEKAPVREYGKTEVMVDTTSPLFGNVAPTTICWMSHFDYISKPAPGFNIVAHTADCPVAAAENREKNLYAIQFHPEVLHTEEGSKMLHNFVRGVCGCAGPWRMDSFGQRTQRHGNEPHSKHIRHQKKPCITAAAQNALRQDRVCGAENNDNAQRVHQLARDGFCLISNMVLANHRVADESDDQRGTAAHDRS